MGSRLTKFGRHSKDSCQDKYLGFRVVTLPKHVWRACEVHATKVDPTRSRKGAGVSL